MTASSYQDAIRRTGILDLLAPFDPHVVGTLPLGIALPDSDIDIVCHAANPGALAEPIWTAFSTIEGFALYRWSAKGRPLVAKFEAEGWPFEIFASNQLVSDQPGFQHFKVEQRLLDLGGFVLRDQIMTLRIQGVKTEPAFATVLGLDGDPYAALSALYDRSDQDLMDIIAMIPDL